MVLQSAQPPGTRSASKNYPTPPPRYTPGHLETSKPAGCDFALACLLAPRALGKAEAEKQTFPAFAEGGGRAAHSQLVDGILRDDRVGGEVRDHVGATEAAGAGGGRLPLAGQSAQGHGASSRRTAPHPGPRPARARGVRVGLRRARGAGSPGSPRPNWALRVARRQSPQP